MWKAAFRGVFAHKLRLFLTALAVVLGVGFVTGTFVLTDTINRTFDNLFVDVTEGVDVYVRAESSFESQLGSSRESVDENLLGEVRRVEGVEAAAGSVTGYAQFIDKQGEPVTTGGAPTLGVSWYDQPKGALDIRAGRAPRGGDEVVMDAATAEAGGFEVGDTVSIITRQAPREFQIVGIAGFGNADNLGGATLAVFDLQTAQGLLEKMGRLDSIDVAAEASVDRQDLLTRLQAVVPEGVEAVASEDVAQEQADTIKGALGFFNTALLVFAGISLFVGSFIIFNTFSVVVAQRTREFALLKALGAGGRQIMAAVLVEALLVAGVASVLGLAAGFGIAGGLSALLGAFGIDLPSTNLVLLPRTVVVGLLLGIAVTLVAAVGPARKAARIAPMEALRTGLSSSAKFSRATMVAAALVIDAGIVILMVGLFLDVERTLWFVGSGALLIFLGLAGVFPLFAGAVARVVGAPVGRMGVPGRLAQRNSVRLPRRTAATAAALMVGLALVGTVSIFADSLKASTQQVVDENLFADFTVSTGGAFGAPTGLSPVIAEEIRQLDEIDSVGAIRFGQFQRERDALAFVVGADVDELTEVADIDVTQGSAGDLADGGIMLSEETADDEGVEVGGNLDVVFAATGPQSLPVVGVFANQALVGSGYLLGLDTFNANFPDAVDQQLFLTIAPGVPAEDAAEALEGIAERYPNISILDQAESREQTVSQINQLLGLVSALLGLALVIAVLGITNTLALSVFERTTELGLLRAVGMARKQARSMIRLESVIIAVMGALVGLAIGVFFGWALVTALDSEGISTLSIPGLQLAAYVAGAALAGILAAVLPARRAARLNVLDAIAHE
ncbi:MAG: FtsX-like permease family protein [Actinomycetota bacterium]